MYLNWFIKECILSNRKCLMILVQNSTFKIMSEVFRFFFNAFLKVFKNQLWLISKSVFFKYFLYKCVHAYYKWGIDSYYTYKLLWSKRWRDHIKVVYSFATYDSRFTQCYVSQYTHKHHSNPLNITIELYYFNHSGKSFFFHCNL